MTIKTEIKDGKGTNNSAKVTSRGQVIVAPLGFSNPVTKLLDVDDTPATFFNAKAGFQFVITDIFISTDFLIGVSGATITIYEADTIDSLVSTKNIVTLNIPKSTPVPILTLNWLINEGKFVVAVSDDSSVNITIAGYYIEAEK